MPTLTSQCYKKSIDLLHQNSDKFGILAASVSPLAKDKHYLRLFGRDGSICALGLISAKNKNNLNLAKKTLLSLANVQSPKGQIPFSFDFKTRQKNYWTPGNLDSTLWWIISSLIYIRETKDKNFTKTVLPKIQKAFVWLSYQDQNEDGLLEQGEASDWADEMPNKGVVLYTNILWFKALSLVAPLTRGVGGLNSPLSQRGARGDFYIPRSELVKNGINSILWQPNGKTSSYFKNSPYIKKFITTSTNITETKKDYFLNYFNHREFGVRCDVYANILAIIFGLASKNQSEKIINFILKNRLNKPFPVVVYYPPIKKKEKDWKNYMSHRDQNYPRQYHNGGIWPYVGGFWTCALKKVGKEKLAKDELEKVAKSNQINNWEFNEYFHGKKGKPMGVKKQSWNAGTFALAYNCLNGGFKI
jgi:hypothetical protein